MKGYPTLYFKSSAGDVQQYNGDRTKEAMISFIQKNLGLATSQEFSQKEELWRWWEPAKRGNHGAAGGASKFPFSILQVADHYRFIEFIIGNNFNEYDEIR